VAPEVVRRRLAERAPVGAGHRPLHWHLLSTLGLSVYVFVWREELMTGAKKEGRTCEEL
jgi:hypothetical protein